MAIAAVLALAPAAAASPAAASPAELESPLAPLQVPSLVVAPSDASLTPADGALEVQVLIRNPSEHAIPEGTVTLSTTQLVTDAELEPEEPREALVEFARVEIGETPPSSEQQVGVDVSIDELWLFEEEPAPGIVEITADFESAGRPHATPPWLSATAPLVWRGDEFANTVPLTLVVPLVLPADTALVPTAAELAAEAPRLQRLLTEAELSAATLAVDPRILAATRLLGEDAPDAALELVERIERTFLPGFLLQFGDADPAAQASLGFTELLAPVGLDFAAQAARSASEAEGEPAADAAELDSGSPLTLTELLAWESAKSVAWPAAGEVGRQTLELLQASKIESVVLDSRNATFTGGTRFEIPGFAGLDALVADTELGDLAEAALSAEHPVDAALARARLAEQLAADAQSDSPGVVLALDRHAVAESAEPAEFIEWISSLTWATTVSEDLQQQTVGTLLPGSPHSSRITHLEESLKRAAQVLDHAPLLEKPELLGEYQRARLLTMLATRYADEPDLFREVALAYVEHDAQLLRGVEVVRTENTHLVSASTHIPIQLHNSLPFTAAVSLNISPLTAGISVPERVVGPELVMAEGNATVLVPVQSRVSSGSSGVLVQVTDLTGEHVSAVDRLTLTLQTELESLILWGLAALAALLFTFGVVRSVLRKRQAAAAT